MLIGKGSSKLLTLKHRWAIPASVSHCVGAPYFLCEAFFSILARTNRLFCLLSCMGMASNTAFACTLSFPAYLDMSLR